MTSWGEYAVRALSGDAVGALADLTDAGLIDAGLTDAGLTDDLAARGTSPEAAAVLAFVQVMTCDFDAAILSRPEGPDPLSRAAHDFVSAVCLAQVAAPTPAARLEPVDGEYAGLAAFLAVESAMSAGHVARAEAEARDREPDLARVAGSSFWAWNQVALARSLVFQGRASEASTVIDQVLADERTASSPAADRIARGVRAFIAALGGDPTPSAEYAAGLLVEFPEPRTYLESASFVLAAFAEQAAGRLDQVERLLLLGGGGVFLPRFQIVDRVYAYEILIEAALADEGHSAAEGHDAAAAWLDRAEALPADDHDLASAALGRCRARLALARNDPETGARESVLSSERAAVVGGDLEVHRGLLLRDWAVRELGLLGRRLRNVPGLGWESLTEQQRRVALLASQGLRNREIGERLFLSERTVEGHVAAVLDALGAPNRVGIARHVPIGPAAPTESAAAATAAAALTPRQRDVAGLVAEGRSNAEIAARLSISEKTVEKHLTDLFARLGVQSRTAVAAAVRG